MAKKTQNEVATAMGIDMSPTLHLSEKDLPDIKNWKVDGTYNLTMKVKETGSQKSPYTPGSPLTADFKILSVSSGDGSDTESDSDYDD